MSPLIKKEIRLVLPSAIVAVLLALPSCLTRRDDAWPLNLLFIGMMMMAISTFGRETSLNTFSALLAQPAERTRLWQVKLSVLSVAFLTVFLVWAGSEFLARPGDVDGTRAVSYTGPFIAVATFTGGLWTTLLLRQLAGAFWLSLLVPVVLASVAGGFLSYTFSDIDSAVYAGLAIILLVYSLAGFFFARRLFYRAQDVGWTGGVIDFSSFSLGLRTQAVETFRRRRPFLALLNKEIKLQSASLVFAAVLFLFHAGVIIFRHVHQFAPESVGGVLTSIVWMVWLVFPLFISCLAIAEERRFGVTESQLCLPVSRRRQFAVKVAFTLLLGIFLSAVVPAFLESFNLNSLIGIARYFPFFLSLSLIGGWFAVAGFFGSSLARNFLQAIGYSLVTIVLCSLSLSAFMDGRMFPFDRLPGRSILITLIGALVLVSTLLWLSWLNFKNFREGWPLWRRNVIGYVSALVLVGVVSPAVYNRSWELLLPADPSHGAARMPVTGSGVTLQNGWDGLTARLPDSRVWYAPYDFQTSMKSWRRLVPYKFVLSTPHFVAGSNWLSVATGYQDFRISERENKPRPTNDLNDHITGYRDVVGVRNDGSLWVSDPSPDGRWTGNQMQRFGRGTNWLQVINFRDGVLLLKTDGTLWQWGPIVFGWTNIPHAWPTLHNYEPVRFGDDADWVALHSEMNLARKSDGTVWRFRWDSKQNQPIFGRESEFDSAIFNTIDNRSFNGQNRSYVDSHGRLWADLPFLPKSNASRFEQTGFIQIGSGTNWISSVATWGRLCALKSDGSVWQWDTYGKSAAYIKQLPSTAPHRMSDHSDYIAVIRNNWDSPDIITLSTDGSLWTWPDPTWYYSYDELLRPSKRPHCIGNIFVAAD